MKVRAVLKISTKSNFMMTILFNVGGDDEQVLLLVCLSRPHPRLVIVLLSAVPGQLSSVLLLCY